MSLAEIQAEHRRIAILRMLAEQPEYRSNASVLADALPRVAHVSATRSQVLAEIAYLETIGAVRQDDLGNGVVGVELTDRGHDAAQGRIVLPGVKRPSPRA